MHVGACKDYMKQYIILSPNHTFAYNIVVLHHQLHVIFLQLGNISRIIFQVLKKTLQQLFLIHFVEMLIS